MEDGHVVTGRIHNAKPLILDQQNDQFIVHEWTDGIIGCQPMPA
jgi:hypothetical protein